MNVNCSLQHYIVFTIISVVYSINSWVFHQYTHWLDAYQPRYPIDDPRSPSNLQLPKSKEPWIPTEEKLTPPPSPGSLIVNPLSRWKSASDLLGDGNESSRLTSMQSLRWKKTTAQRLQRIQRLVLSMQKQSSQN